MIQVCDNEGVCVLDTEAESGPGYHCQCQESYTGQHCQVRAVLGPRLELDTGHVSGSQPVSE